MIMLIDDRIERQIKFTQETGIDINEYDDILDNFTAEAYDDLLEEFKNEDYSKLDAYDIIITHRSAFGEINSKVISKFKGICREQQKTLVFFSGGISSISINELPFKHLLLNSKIFYSINLKLFLDEANENNYEPLILALGSSWKINLLLNSLEKINLFIGKNELEQEIIFDEFYDEVDIDLIKDFITFKQPEVVNDFIKMNDLKKLTFNLANQIKQQVVLNV